MQRSRTFRLSIGAVCALTACLPFVGPADAASTPSPFAGEYDAWFQPIPGTGAWSLTISQSGGVRGTGAFAFLTETGSLTGKVASGGALSVTITWTASGSNGKNDENDGGGSVFAASPAPSLAQTKRTIARTAAVALDANGDLVGVADDGQTFVWTRR